MGLVLRTGIVAIVAAALLALGCGRSNFQTPTNVVNPAPPVRLGEFQSVEVADMSVAPAVLEEEKEYDANLVASNIMKQFRSKIQYLTSNWNNDPQRPPTRGALLIRPVMSQLKWVTRGERVWAGSMYGNSAVVIDIEFADKADGTVFARPMLFARANAMGGAWGMQDDAMVTRMAEMMANYVIQNHASPVGGPTGVE